MENWKLISPFRFFHSQLRTKFAGGDDGIRTHDPLLAGQVLSQLSYTPILNECLLFLRFLHLVKMVGPSGLEPPTSCLSGTRSNLLSYEPMWCFFALECDNRNWKLKVESWKLRFKIRFSVPVVFSVKRVDCSTLFSVSALSYLPVRSPAKYFHHCRA